MDKYYCWHKLKLHVKLKGNGINGKAGRYGFRCASSSTSLPRLKTEEAQLHVLLMQAMGLK